MCQNHSYDESDRMLNSPQNAILFRLLEILIRKIMIDSVTIVQSVTILLIHFGFGRNNNNLYR